MGRKLSFAIVLLRHYHSYLQLSAFFIGSVMRYMTDYELFIKLFQNLLRNFYGKFTISVIISVTSVKFLHAKYLIFNSYLIF
jgi:hypothetical protein